MRPLRTFTIEPSLPQELAPLVELAHNLWWTWHPEVISLLRDLNPHLWREVDHNPMAFLSRITPDEIEELITQHGGRAASSVSKSTDYLVAGEKAARGIIVDGAGIGSCMAANKVPGVRAALCYDKASARNSREHNDSNVLTLGGRMLTQSQAEDVVRTWLSTPFGGGRHASRVNKITALEQKYSKWTQQR